MNYLSKQYLALDPYLNGLFLYLILGGVCLAIILTFWRARRSRILRTLLCLVFAIFILNPTLVEEEREDLPTVVAIVLDNSESMEFGERAEIAQRAKDKIIAQLSDDPRFTPRLTQTQSQDDSTKLMARLREVFADVPREQIGGSILITDGQVHDVPLKLSSMVEFGPIHALITGDPNKQDRRLEIIKRSNFGVVGETVNFTIKVSDPAFAGRRIPVQLSINTQPPRTVFVTEGMDSVVDIDVERRGENIIIFETEEGPDELTLANNARTETISGVFDRLRVLLVTGQPNAAGRVWRDLLKSDPSVDLVHFTILRPPFKTDGAKMEELSLITFPTDALFRDKLDRFNLIIFDQYKRRHVITDSYLNNMARYVDDGGALLVVAGPPFATRNSLANSPLRSVLPAAPNGEVQTEYFKPQISNAGKRHTVTEPLLDAANTWGGWYRHIGSDVDVGDVLLESESGSPLLVLNRVGRGRVGQLMSDQIWLWARGHQGGGPYVSLIRRLVHWLMKEPELEERQLDMQMSALGDSATINLKTLNDTANALFVEDPEGGVAKLDWQKREEGSYYARVKTPKLGLYRARSDGLQAIALKGPSNPIEFQEPVVTQTILEPIAKQTGGHITNLVNQAVDIPDIRQITRGEKAYGRGWIGLNDRQAYVVKNSKAVTIFPGAIGAGLMVLLSLLLWWREGR